MAKQQTERNAEIIRRRQAGEGPRQIAREMGLSASVVAGVLWRSGMTDGSETHCGRGNGYSDDIRKAAVEYAAKTTFAAAGRRFGLPSMTVWTWWSVGC